MTRFQIYPQTELACKYTKSLYKTQHSEVLVEYEQGFDMRTGKLIRHPMATYHSTSDENSYIPVSLLKNTGNIGGKLKPQDKNSAHLSNDSTRLSVMNNTNFGAIHYDIHLDKKLDYTISRIFQEMSLTELETLHQLCGLERTQVLQSLALAVLKISYTGYLSSGNGSCFTDYEGNSLWYYTCTKNSHLYMFLKTKDVIEEYQFSTKTEYILLIHSPKELRFQIQQPIWIKKQPQFSTIEP